VWAAAFLNTTRRPDAGQVRRPGRRNRDGSVKDQGLIHEIVTSVSYVDNILWRPLLRGSRYDGRYWHNFLTKTADFLELHQLSQGVTASALFCTDKGLAYYDA